MGRRFKVRENDNSKLKTMEKGYLARQESSKHLNLSKRPVIDDSNLQFEPSALSF
jgi:hypothetical protein